MTATKKTELLNPEQEPSDTTVKTVIPESGENDQIIEWVTEQTHEEVFFSTTDEGHHDLLAQHSFEYQQMLAFQNGLHLGSRDSFSQVLRNATIIINMYFDIYNRQFTIPDEMLNLPIECGKDGTYYISLEDGYLCFIKDPAQRNDILYLTGNPLFESFDEQDPFQENEDEIQKKFRQN